MLEKTINDTTQKLGFLKVLKHDFLVKILDIYQMIETLGVEMRIQKYKLSHFFHKQPVTEIYCIKLTQSLKQVDPNFISSDPSNRVDRLYSIFRKK